jgi:hypothetical protein
VVAVEIDYIFFIGGNFFYVMINKVMSSPALITFSSTSQDTNYVWAIVNTVITIVIAALMLTYLIKIGQIGGKCEATWRLFRYFLIVLLVIYFVVLIIMLIVVIVQAATDQNKKKGAIAKK